MGIVKAVTCVLFLAGCLLLSVSGDLEEGGDNVCARTFIQTVNVTVETTRTISEVYQDCCEEAWGTCTVPCTKSRVREVVGEKLVEQTQVAEELYCCDGYEQQGSQCEPVAPLTQLNLVFIIQTNKLTTSQVKAAAKMAGQTIANLPSEWNAKVAAIQFHTNTSEVFALGQYSTSEEMMTELKTLTKKSGRPVINKAIEAGVAVLDGATEGRKFIVYIGSGMGASRRYSSSSYIETRAAAQAAQSNGITLISVRNGYRSSMGSLLAIASYPKADHLVSLRRGVSSAANRTIEILNRHFEGGCVDPVSNLAVVSDDMCTCVSGSSKSLSRTIAKAIAKVSEEMSNKTAVAFVTRWSKSVHRFSSSPSSYLLLRFYRLVNFMIPKSGCPNNRLKTFETAVQDLYNKEYTEQLGATGKFKVALLMSCQPLDKTDLLSFQRTTPDEVIHPFNLVIDQSGAGPADSFSFTLSEIDELVAAIKQQQAQSQACYSE